MASDQQTDVAVNDQPSVDSVSKKNAEENDKESSPKRAKVDEGDTPSKRGRNSLGKQKSDDKVMAEAKAVYGDLDLSEGRRLRKRSDQPKAEEKKKTTPRKNTRKKQSEKEEDEEKSAGEKGSHEDNLSPTKNGDKEMEQEQKEDDPVETKDKEQEQEGLKRDEIRDDQDNDKKDEAKPASE